MVGPDKSAFGTAPDLARKVLNERVRILYEVSPYGYVAALIGIAMASYGLYGVVANSLLMVWAPLQLLATAGRLAVYAVYRRAAGKAPDPVAWERYFAAAAGFAGLGWGLLAPLLMPAHSIPHQFLVVFIVSVMTLAGMASMLPSRLAFGWFAMPALIGLVWELAARGGQLYFDAAVLAIGLFALMFFLFQRINRNMQDMLAGRFENDALIDDLSQTERNLQAALLGVAYMQDRDVLRCNRRFAQMFGFQETELLGKPTRSLFPSEEDYAAISVRAWRAVETLGSYREERALLRKDGSEIWCSLAVQPLDPADAAKGTIWIAEDLSERKQAERELRRSEERLALALRASDSGIWDRDIEEDSVFYSPRYREMLGYPDLSNDRFRALYRFHDALHAEDSKRVLKAGLRALETRQPFAETYRLRCADGAYRWFVGHGQAQYDGQGRAVRFAGSITDVTVLREREAALARARAEADAANERLRDAIESIPDPFALFDSSDRLVLCNQQYAQTFFGGQRFEDIAGKTFEELVRASISAGEAIPPEFDGDAEAWIAASMRLHRNPGAGETLIQTGAGRWYQMRERRTREGGIVGVRTDVTDLKASEARVRHLSQHDPLTGLPNRRLLQDRMEQAFTLARRNKTQVAILLVDLDRFKVINDVHGHRAGDEVLREVANRLRGCVREADTVARHGGDEFVVLLPELQRTLDATRVADKIVEAVAAPVAVESLEFKVGASIGISVYPADGQESDTLLRLADQAMYRMKQEGGGGVRSVSLQEN
jgi:diguanylate cyclase (GGDEF)-like protein/PAS domain S-box-containing protein